MMGYSGYTQYLLPDGSLVDKDAYEEYFNEYMEKYVWCRSVDQTNGGKVRRTPYTWGFDFTDEYIIDSYQHEYLDKHGNENSITKYKYRPPTKEEEDAYNQSILNDEREDYMNEDWHGEIEMDFKRALKILSDMQDMHFLKPKQPYSEEENDKIISHEMHIDYLKQKYSCLLYTSPSPRDQRGSRMPSSA